MSIKLAKGQNTLDICRDIIQRYFDLFVIPLTRSGSLVTHVLNTRADQVTVENKVLVCAAFTVGSEQEHGRIEVEVGN